MKNYVKPLKPLAPYLGGKSRLAKTIVQRIESVPHKTYAECFVGMGGIFFCRTNIPKLEVINDFSREISNFFRILQKHHGAFVDLLRFQINSRCEFERLNKIDTSTMTDLERAARFFYLQKTAFGGKIKNRSFGVSNDRGSRFNILQLELFLEEVHRRLSSVVIECLPFDAFITRYDHSEALFYLDPPYYGNEDDYGKNMFERKDFERLAEILSGIKGKFILSLNDVPQVRQIFSDFCIESVETTYSISQNGNSKVKEVIICDQKTLKYFFKAQELLDV